MNKKHHEMNAKNQSMNIFQLIFATCLCFWKCFCVYFPLFRFGTIITAAVLLFPLSSFSLCRCRRLCLPALSHPPSFCLLGNFITCPQTRESERVRRSTLARSLHPSRSGSNFVCWSAVLLARDKESAKWAPAARRRFRGSLSHRHICVVSFGFVRSGILFGSLLCAADREATRAVCWLNSTYTHSTSDGRSGARIGKPTFAVLIIYNTTVSVWCVEIKQHNRERERLWNSAHIYMMGAFVGWCACVFVSF